MKKVITQTQTEKEKKDEELKLSILSKADENKGEQLFITDNGNVGIKNEIEELLKHGQAIDNPEKKYDIYYKGIERMLRKHLPKGKQYAKARGYIREEKCVFMTRGKRLNENGFRGADSRMGYVTDAEQVLNIIAKWVLNGGTMVELHNELRELNIKMGYGKRIIY